MRRRGQLTAQEADEHPQRSIITRALGPEPDVLVDTSSWRGAAGDVYLLCSDGLTSMVPETHVAEILRAAGSLREGGRGLIDAANEAGGRDNITVILFRLEEVVAAADAALEQPTSVGGSAGTLTTGDVQAAIAGAAPAPAPAAAAQAPPRADAPPRRREAPQRLAPSAPPPAATGSHRARRFAKVFAILALILLPLGFGAYSANQAVFFIGTNGEGFVTLYRGLPYSLPAGLDLFKVNYVSGVPLQTLPAGRRKQLVDHTLRSHDDASDLVRELERGRIAAS
jgi:protein phosphatase